MPPELPLELQRMVIEELRLPRLPVGTRRHLNTDFIQTRSALRNLCLTSRCHHEIAEPLLYESIALTRDAQFVHLLNSLLANRDRRSWIRSIACPMCVMTEANTSEVLPLWNQLFAPRKGAALDHREERAFQIAGLERGHILEADRWINDGGPGESGSGLCDDGWGFCDQLFAVIICLTTRLENILVQIPTDKDDLGGLDNLARALRSGVHANETGVLQSLKSVRVQRTRFRMEDEPPRPEVTTARPQYVEPMPDEGFGIDPLRLHTFDIQNVEEVEYCGDNGIWFMLLKANHGPWTEDTLPHDLRRFRSLKSLKLHESRTTPSFLRYLLDEAHSLETFHYTTRRQEWRINYWCAQYVDYVFMPPDFSSMNETLWTARKTVKELVLGSVQRPWADGDEEHRHVELIVVLGAFERLTHLSIDVRWLVPIMLDLDEEVAMVPLYKKLPQSIEDIKLTETWTRSDLRALSRSPALEKQAMAWVHAALWTLLGDDDDDKGDRMKLAHLRKVTLTAIPAFHTHRTSRLNLDEEEEDDDSQCMPLKSDEGIGQTKSMFARHGTAFNIEWMRGHLPFNPSSGHLESG